MIRAYPGRPSVRAGETLTLHVSGDEPRFRIAIYRWEDGLVPVRVGAWLRAEHLPDGRADEDWQWPPYQVETGDDWPSGVYLAHLELPQGQPLRLSADSAAALFVVRARASKTILYKLPVATWHPYNCSGGGCFYTNPPRSAHSPGARVSLHRPGGGIGGLTWGAQDHDDPRSPRQTFAHWDARFIRWMARCGYARHARFHRPAARTLDLRGHRPGARRIARRRYLAAAAGIRVRRRTGRPHRAGRPGHPVALARRGRDAGRLPVAGCLPARPALVGHGAGEGIHVAAMGMFRHGGTVFSAGTTDWAQVLGEARDRRVERITRNVLDRLCHA
ncbi:hypothetical protein FG94_00714 [Massilia sp. LC238]|nr:hypothetical protein FG94_00714 [Massilia sp. LC238]